MFKHFAWLWLMMGVPTGTNTASAGPICPIEDQSHCQSAATGQFILPSDRMLGIRRADDFRPAGSTISHLCFFPCFIGSGTEGWFECSAEGETPPDDFILEIYEDDFGIPGALVAGIPANGLALTIEAKANSNPGSGSICWRYSAPVAPPTGITVTPNECYWLEITGLGEAQAQGVCHVYSLSSQDGNAYSLGDDNSDYQVLSVGDVDRNDLAFCLDSGLIGASNPAISYDGGCGDFPAACCRIDQLCSEGTLSNCWGTQWSPIIGTPILHKTCAEINAPFGCPHIAFDYCHEAVVPIECQNQLPNPSLGTCSVSGGSVPIYEVCDFTVGTPPGHDCPSPNATCLSLPSIVDAYRCTFISKNAGASTDGPQSPPTSCAWQGALRLDVWHLYTAPCNGVLTIQNCEHTSYDSRVELFGDHTNNCIPCPITNLSQELICADGDCFQGGGDEIRIGVTANACYIIRVAGSGFANSPTQDNWGISELDLGVVCNIDAGSLNSPAPTPAPHDLRKNRYVSFVPNNPGVSIAFGVAKPVTGPATCWVSAPDANGNAKCLAAPVFRVWDEPVVHVGDCEIAPVQDYDIFSSPDGVNVHLPGLRVETIRLPALNNKFWGDVAGVNNGTEWTAPNQFTNVNDILAVLAYISNAAIKPTFQMVNLQAVSSADPCLNAFVNTADVLMVVKASAGDAYPFTTDPANCPSCP